MGGDRHGEAPEQGRVTSRPQIQRGAEQPPKPGGRPLIQRGRDGRALGGSHGQGRTSVIRHRSRGPYKGDPLVGIPKAEGDRIHSERLVTYRSYQVVRQHGEPSDGLPRL